MYDKLLQSLNHLYSFEPIHFFYYEDSLVFKKLTLVLVSIRRENAVYTTNHCLCSLTILLIMLLYPNFNRTSFVNFNKNVFENKSQFLLTFKFGF